MKKKHEYILRELSSLCGVSGYSTDIAKVFLREAKKLSLACAGDSLGSVSASMPANKPLPGVTKRIMVSAHVDTVGYMVTHVNHKELELVKIGGPVLEGAVEGGLKTKAKTIPITIVDDGEEELSAKAYVNDPENLPLVRPGDPVFFSNELEAKPRGKFTGPGLDNKAGILALMMVMEKLATSECYHNLFFVLPALEELDSQGVYAAVQKIKPAFVINIDTFESEARLSRGPGIQRGPVYNSELVEYAEDVATKNKIQYTLDACSDRAHSDMDLILQANGGTPGCEILIPCYNLHTPNERVSKKDIELTYKLVYKMCLELKSEINLVPGGLNGM